MSTEANMAYLAVAIWVVCGLLQLANDQTACDNAVAALINSTVCNNALLDTNTTTVCTTCQDIFVAIDNNCDGQVSMYDILFCTL